MCSSDLDRIVFALDNDDAGRSATKSLVSKCKERGVEAWFFNYDNTEMKDVGGMSRDEVNWGLAYARHILRGAKV